MSLLLAFRTFDSKAGNGLEIGTDDPRAHAPPAPALGDFEQQFIRTLIENDWRSILIGHLATVDVIAMDDLAV